VHILKSKNLQEGLAALRETIEDVMSVKPKVDTDLIFINKVISSRIKEIGKHMD
jgi:hypothetical protein